MSMTYYAVTDDPNELAHFGIPGMKWGRRRTPEQLGHPRHTGSRRSKKPRSAAYKKASGKLSSLMKSGIKKAEAHWKAYNSPQAREQRFMKKAVQQARNGTLKYGKLTDDQVRQVTDRLFLERQARQLGSTENPRYWKRLGSAVGEGIIRGIGQGTTSYIDERMRGRGRITAEIKGKKRMAKYEADERVLRREAKKQADKEYYEEMAKEGNLHTKAGNVARAAGMLIATKGHVPTNSEQWREIKGSFTQKGRARTLAQKRIADKNEERSRRQQEVMTDAYYKALGAQGAKHNYEVFTGNKSSDADKKPVAVSKPKAANEVVFTHVPRRRPRKGSRAGRIR